MRTSRRLKTRTRETATPKDDRSAPQRTCVGCRTRVPQHRLVRCALLPDGTAVISRTASGRGAWLCAENPACFQVALKRNGFERAWRRSASSQALSALQIAFEQLVDNMKDLTAAGTAAAGRVATKG